MSLTLERLRELLDYSPETGVFTWKIKRKKVNPGDIAGSIAKKRYCMIQLDGKHYLAHRLAWLFVRGKWPRSWIDHINHDRFDNRIENLREATPEQSARNLRGNRVNKTGIKGVYSRPNGRFEVWIMQSGVHYYLGRFASKEAAAATYANAARSLHGDFAYKGG